MGSSSHKYCLGGLICNVFLVFIMTHFTTFPKIGVYLCSTFGGQGPVVMSMIRPSHTPVIEVMSGLHYCNSINIIQYYLIFFRFSLSWKHQYLDSLLQEIESNKQLCEIDAWAGSVMEFRMFSNLTPARQKLLIKISILLPLYLLLYLNLSTDSWISLPTPQREARREQTETPASISCLPAQSHFVQSQPVLTKLN